MSYSERVALCLSLAAKYPVCPPPVIKPRRERIDAADIREPFPETRKMRRKHAPATDFSEPRENSDRKLDAVNRPGRGKHLVAQNKTVKAAPVKHIRRRAALLLKPAGHIPRRLSAREESQNIPDNRHPRRRRRNRQTEPEHHLRRLESPQEHRLSAAVRTGQDIDSAAVVKRDVIRDDTFLRRLTARFSDSEHSFSTAAVTAPSSRRRSS